MSSPLPKISLPLFKVSPGGHQFGLDFVYLIVTLFSHRFIFLGHPILHWFSKGDFWFEIQYSRGCGVTIYPVFLPPGSAPALAELRGWYRSYIFLTLLLAT